MHADKHRTLSKLDQEWVCVSDPVLSQEEPVLLMRSKFIQSSLVIDPVSKHKEELGTP